MIFKIETTGPGWLQTDAYYRVSHTQRGRVHPGSRSGCELSIEFLLAVTEEADTISESELTEPAHEIEHRLTALYWEQCDDD